MRAAFALALTICIAGCSTAPAPMPQPVPASRPIAAPPATSPLDTCGAAEWQHLVGRPRSEVPVAVRPEQHRVVCATCPVATDADQTRLNFIFDAATGLISAVRCG